MKYTHMVMLAFIASSALADSPLPPPERLTFCSASGNTCAVSDPLTNTTIVSSRGSYPLPWAISGWHRWLIVSDDGDSVVKHQGLAPTDVTLETPVIFFFNRSGLVRTVTLGDLYKSRSELSRTASHFEWARNIVVNNANQLVVELVSGKKVAFAVNSGSTQPIVSEGK